MSQIHTTTGLPVVLQGYFALPSQMAHYLHMGHMWQQLLYESRAISTPALTVLAAYILYLVSLWIFIPTLLDVASRIHRRCFHPTYAFVEMSVPTKLASTRISMEPLSRLLQANHQRLSIFPYPPTYSLELSATDGKSVHYLIGAPTKQVPRLAKSLQIHFPDLQVLESSNQPPLERNDYPRAVAEMKLKSDFTLPLRGKILLKEYDPLNYVAGQMAKLRSGETASLQLIVSPIRPTSHYRITRRIHRFTKRIASRKTVSSELAGITDTPKLVLKALVLLATVVLQTLWLILSILLLLLGRRSRRPRLNNRSHIKRKQPDAYEKSLTDSIHGKITQPLFETSIRIVTGDLSGFAAAKNRLNYLLAPLKSFSGPDQQLVIRTNLPGSQKRRLRRFNERRHSHQLLRLNPVLSASELEGLFHLPKNMPEPRPHRPKSSTAPDAKSQPQSNTRPEEVGYGNDLIYDDRFDPIGLQVSWLTSDANTIEKTPNEPTVVPKTRLKPPPRQQLQFAFGEIITTAPMQTKTSKPNH